MKITQRLFLRHGSFYLQLLVVSLCLIWRSSSQSFYRSLSMANFSSPVIYPGDKGYRQSVVMANYDCKFLCPYVVIHPETSETYITITNSHQYEKAAEVASAISISKTFDVPLSTRGGGHGYTCQGSKHGGIMLDMRKLKAIEINGLKSPTNQISMTIGTGLVWGEVLKHLRSLDDDLITVHGQCTAVGVAGYSLHGGVHFGGLSELYGLSSDNILALTAVVANGSIVELSGSKCIIDGVSVAYSEECRGLWFGFRGAGSSFGVVTSLTLKLYRETTMRSALSILSLKINDVTDAQRFLSEYVDSIPSEVSLTFFGLDAYFKAYSFTLLFSKNKKNAVFYDFLALIPKNSEPTVHFIVEASWQHASVSNSTDTKRSKGSKLSNNDATFQILKSLHSELSNNHRNGNGSKIAACRDWLSSDRPWSVPSYDLVWGAGHSYGGSSIIVDKKYEEITIKQSLESFKMHVEKNTGKCSDCVIVFHRIGEKLRNRIATKRHSNSSELIKDENDTDGQYEHAPHTESFNPFRQNGSLWVEMDCGHFYPQRDSWPACSSFIDETQRAFDRIVPKRHKSHYPNVPNLVTEDWREQYYGEEGYKRLQEVKQIWDPENIFRHSQSVSVLEGESTGDVYTTLGGNSVTSSRSGGVGVILDRLNNSSPSDRLSNNETDIALLNHCVAMYDRSAMSDLRNILDVTRISSKLAEKLRSVVKKWDSRRQD